MSSKICATCKYCYIHSRGNGTLSREGYCYGNPPYIGGMYPKVKLKSQACRLYEDNQGKKNILSLEE
jgi:hypothetical protein